LRYDPRRTAIPALTDIPDAEEARDDVYLRELAFQQVCLQLARPQTIIGAGRWQLPTRRRPIASQAALRAQCYSRCSRASLAFDSILSRRNSVDCPFHSFGDFRDGAFGFWNGIQAFVGGRGQRDVITHDLISESRQTANQSRRQSFRYGHLIRYRQRCGERRGGRVINSANAKPIAPAINIELSGLSCTFFAITCEPSRKVSPLFS